MFVFVFVFMGFAYVVVLFDPELFVFDFDLCHKVCIFFRMRAFVYEF